MTKIVALYAALEAAEFRASIWRDRRIYINGFGRDIKAYIELDNPADEADTTRLFDGAALRVYSNCDSQPAIWRMNRAKQVKHELMERLHASGITAYLGPPCARWQDVV